MIKVIKNKTNNLKKKKKILNNNSKINLKVIKMT